jgi:hypothetical protein
LSFYYGETSLGNLKNVKITLYQKVEYQDHALLRMGQRGITFEEIETVLANYELLKYYLNAKPCPAALLLGWPNSRPVHVVIAFDHEEEASRIITVYEPDPLIWEAGFRSKRK